LQVNITIPVGVLDDIHYLLENGLDRLFIIIRLYFCKKLTFNNLVCFLLCFPRLRSDVGCRIKVIIAGLVALSPPFFGTRLPRSISGLSIVFKALPEPTHELSKHWAFWRSRPKDGFARLKYSLIFQIQP